MKRYSKDTEARPGPLSKGVFLTQRLKSGKMSWTKSFRLCLGLIVRYLGQKQQSLLARLVKSLKVKLLAGETIAIIIVIKWVDHSKLINVQANFDLFGQIVQTIFECYF